MSKQEPLWKSIRGVGKPGTHKPTWEKVDLGTVPYKEYDEFNPGPSAPMLKVQPPHCKRCGLPATPKWPNDWWCHFCFDEVKAPMRPNAMIPVEAVPEDGHLLPSITDPRGDMICPKCGTTRLPRADNQGYDCKCGITWTVPGVRRVSPTNGF